MSNSSVNFGFLATHDVVLLRHAVLAERYVFADPNAALVKIRQLAETLAKSVAAQVGLPCSDEDKFRDVERSLRDRGLLDRTMHQVMRTIRLAGNDAVHSLAGEQRQALYQLKLLRQIALWFHRTVTRDASFKAGPFVPPPNPQDADETLLDELRTVREVLAEKQAKLEGIELQREQLEQRIADAESQAQKAYENELAALELAEETEAQLREQLAEYERQLEELSRTTASAPLAEQEKVVRASQEAIEQSDLDEFDTRKLIDQQLREAGWEADSVRLRYSKGTRPRKGRNIAIAEWPTLNGPADYVLFTGDVPIGSIEAKRKRRNARSALGQAERYAKDIRIPVDLTFPGGPWGEYQLPFVFSSNGNPYLRQLIEESGIWFRDARDNTNHARALTGWYTPDGLTEQLKTDVDASIRRLEHESSDYLPLHYYQREAIEAVEAAIGRGQRDILLAMATGTGKTRTCICLIYRLIKAQRFNRVLFVVDRTSLGEQATAAFKELKLENNQTFSGIYEVKELGDLRPDGETRLHVATIQAMVRRVVEGEYDAEPFPIDTYDCVVVDECHRGYILDRDMSEREQTYRSQEDYISKYRRVLDHFDSVRIGLTATPALHTSQIFGEPVYNYSFRRAVLDGYLVDQHPPYIIRTKLSKQGLTWKKGQRLQIYDTAKKTVTTSASPDEVKIDIEGFNSRAITKPFNRVVCKVLAEHIPPSRPGKTLIFCVNDLHARIVVSLLTEALERRYGPIDHRMVQKITGDVDDSSQLIREFKKELLPQYAVTVDLLTTGIDVPEITNIVFIRRTASRILYDQMVGRATRLRPNLYGQGDDKDCFRIYDAVDMYRSIQKYTDMQPVVVTPKTNFARLVAFLTTSTDQDVLNDVRDQIVAKLNRKVRTIRKKWLETFETLAGDPPEIIAERFRLMTPEQMRDWFDDHELLIRELDKMRAGSELFISEEEDELLEVVETVSSETRPKDYLEAFASYLRENADSIPALLLVTQRPRDLTRSALRELEVKLRTDGFSVDRLRETNQNIAASIIDFIRFVMLDEPLMPIDARVDSAISEVLSSQLWAGAMSASRTTRSGCGWSGSEDSSRLRSFLMPKRWIRASSAGTAVDSNGSIGFLMETFTNC